MSEKPEVIKCTECGFYYNGSQYAQCPHCVNSDGEAGMSVGKKKKWSWKRISSPLGSLTGEQKNVGSKQPAAEEQNVTETDDTPENSGKKEEMIQTIENEKKEEVSASEGKKENVVPPTVGISKLTPSKAYVPTGETYRSEQQAQKIELTGSDTNSDIPEWMKPSPIDKKVIKPEETKGNTSSPTLTQSIEKLGKTTSKYVRIQNGQTVDPMVGWLIGVKGAYYGQALPLKSGANRVGRSHEMEVPLMQDDSVSRDIVVKIIYDVRGNQFNAIPGNASSLCYVNGEALYERKTLEGFEEFEFGDQERNKFVFIPLCGDRFLWSDYPY